MSGPKRFSVHVFDKQLRKLFKLQAEVSTLWSELNRLMLEDKQQRTTFDEKDWIRDHKKEFAALQQFVAKNENSELKQDEFDELYSRIFLRFDQLTQFRELVSEQIGSFHRLEENYRTRFELLEAVERMKSDFEKVKKQALDYLKKNVGDAVELQTAQKKINKLAFTFEVPPFDRENQTDYQNLAKQLPAYYESLKRHLNLLITGGKSEDDFQVQKLPVSLILPDENDQTGRDIAKLYRLIDEALNKIPDQSLDEKFRLRFEALQNKGADSQLFGELLDDIMEISNQQEYSMRLNRVLEEVDYEDLDKTLTGHVRKLRQDISRILKSGHIKPVNANNIVKEWEKIKVENHRITSQRLSQKQEQEFIRSRLLAELHDMDYEVFEDMQVVDFEENREILMEVPGQQNYINLRFDEQGKMLYNFLIPENRKELTHDQVQQKLAEMEQTCDEFRLVLKNLRDQGLDFELEDQGRVSEDNLIRLPEKFAGKVEKQQPALKKRRKKSSRRYLNR